MSAAQEDLEVCDHEIAATINLVQQAAEELSWSQEDATEKVESLEVAYPAQPFPPRRQSTSLCNSTFLSQT